MSDGQAERGREIAPFSVVVIGPATARGEVFDPERVAAKRRA
jgi:hypothetical protein